MPDHLYVRGGKRRNLPKFERRYGKTHGKEVYGAVVGKVKREREAKKKDPPFDGEFTISMVPKGLTKMGKDPFRWG